MSWGPGGEEVADAVRGGIEGGDTDPGLPGPAAALRGAAEAGGGLPGGPCGCPSRSHRPHAGGGFRSYLNPARIPLCYRPPPPGNKWCKD